MIGLEHERTRNGAGADFFDALSLDFCDGDRGLFGLARITRFPNAGRTCAVVLLVADGELVLDETLQGATPIESWEHAALDGVTIATPAPLERFTATASGEGASFELEAHAISPPAGDDDHAAALARASGLDRYEQVCDVSGQATVGGRSVELRCRGRRLHVWGERDWNRVELFRSLYAATSEGGAIAAASVRPAKAPGHGDEAHVAYLLAGEQAPLAFADVRISTVYGRDGLAAKAGLELHTEGSEFPNRVAGVAAFATSLGACDHQLGISFMRWSMEGRPALGCYETFVRP